VLDVLSDNGIVWANSVVISNTHSINRLLDFTSYGTGPIMSIATRLSGLCMTFTGVNCIEAGLEPFTERSHRSDVRQAIC